jgi:hypothetical protein
LERFFSPELFDGGHELAALGLDCLVQLRRVLAGLGPVLENGSTEIRGQPYDRELQRI